MSYYKMFKDIGILDNEDNLPNMASFDIDNNCQKSSDELFILIEGIYTDNDFLTDLFGFIVELKILYKEAGVNLGCLFIERNFKKEFKLNLCDDNKLEMQKIFNLNGYIENIFYRMLDIKIKPELENFFPGLKNKINLLKRDYILDSRVPEEAINFVLNSAELRKLSYCLIKTGFKCGFFLCFAYNTLHMQLSEEVGNYLPGDWQIH
jgi:hypothetical protein